VTVSVGLALLAAVPLAPDTVLVFTVHHGDEHGQEARSIVHVSATLENEADPTLENEATGSCCLVCRVLGLDAGQGVDPAVA
jgi:hypothetical protein